MDPTEEFDRQYRERQAALVKPTILVCGYTGAGKTSLIQAVCGRDTVPDDRIGHGRPMTAAFVPYRNAFINLWDSKGLEPGTQEGVFLRGVRDLVARLQADPDPGNHIHLVWYAVQGPGARVTAADLELIRGVFPNVIVVLTKDDITRPPQREALRAELVQGGVAAADVVAVAEDDPASLRELVGLSLRRLPAAYREAFHSAQLVDLAGKREKAQAVIHGAAAAAAAVAGLNPIPISDAALITPAQFGMIAGLAVVYGLPAEAVKTGAAPLVAQVAGVMAASSLTKLIPWLGVVIQAGVAAALTEVLGQFVDRYLVHCCEARIRGLPLPEFRLPLDSLAELLRAHKLTPPAVPGRR